MPVPTIDTNHAAEGNALLISRYQNLQVVAGMVRAIMNRVQLYENAVFQFLHAIVLANHPLPGGPWDILDKIGLIVGEMRNGRGDADYVLAIILRIRVNRSNGLAEDIIQITALLISGATYREWAEAGPMAFDVEVQPCAPAVRDALLNDLNEARQVTSMGTLRQSNNPAASIIRWGSSARPGSGTGYASGRLGPPRFVFCSARSMVPAFP